MFTISKTTFFESAHQLKGHPKCGKLHGHTYRAEVSIISNNLEKPHKFVLDYAIISDYFKKLDHSGKVIRVSCETLAQQAANYFYSLNDNIIEAKVKLWEGQNNSAEFTI